MYINKATILGNLTRDPEMRALPNGTKVTSFSLATNRTWKGADGTRQEATEYHNAVAFAKPAELIAQYCKKGSSLYIEGRLQTRSWEQEGQKKYRTEIVVENFQFGPKPTGGTSTYNADQSASSKKDAPKNAKEDDLESIEYPQENVNIDDIPF